MGVVVRRYIDFLILLIHTPLFILLSSSIPPFCSFINVFLVFVPVLFIIKFYVLNIFLAQFKHIHTTTGVPR